MAGVSGGNQGVEISVSTCVDVPLLLLRGELDHPASDLLRSTIRRATGEGGGSVLLDLSRVTYLDSGGLSVLYDILDHLPEGAVLGAISPTADVLRMLAIIGLTGQPAFRVFESREEAGEACRRRSR